MNLNCFCKMKRVFIVGLYTVWKRSWRWIRPSVQATSQSGRKNWGTEAEELRGLKDGVWSVMMEVGIREEGEKKLEVEGEDKEMVQSQLRKWRPQLLVEVERVEKVRWIVRAQWRWEEGGGLIMKRRSEEGLNIGLRGRLQWMGDRGITWI